MVAARRSHRAALLSGGEQQAVAIARALAASPGCCCWTRCRSGWRRPSSTRFYQLLPAIQGSGVSVLLVEQDVDRALAASSRTVCLLEGRSGHDRRERLAGPGRPHRRPTSASRRRCARMTVGERHPPGIFLGGAYALTAVGLSLMFGVDAHGQPGPRRSGGVRHLPGHHGDGGAFGVPLWVAMLIMVPLAFLLRPGAPAEPVRPGPAQRDDGAAAGDVRPVGHHREPAAADLLGQHPGCLRAASTWPRSTSAAWCCPGWRCSS